MSMPWAVCGHSSIPPLPGQPLSSSLSTFRRLEGLVRREATPGVLLEGLERRVKGYHTSVAEGQGPRGDPRGPWESQSSPLGSMELWGFACSR